MADHGLRERKKRATRQLIADVASGLFIQRGFEEVTVAEVAEAAGVSKMTVFNYFPRKEDLFLDRHADRLADLVSAVRTRPPGVSAAEALRRHQHDLLAAGHPLSGAIAGGPGFWWVLKSSPALTARWYEQEREIAEAFAEVFTEETGDAFRSRMAAGLLTTAITTVFSHAMNRIVAGDDTETVRREQVAVIDQAFDLAEHGVGNYPG
ncbi:TetR/AcrR family transcriptional regulator [Amycolatopsis sp., V23-08]|uniref:TetR/AcrR family transcriptional regulator n=1 Tax=Amycolatopsis heterodermiae TaxID=3110235 RepID=A0ABU5RBN9_9PSEU|nr:TetR/AcrR family transcriptional regulator [Amycolatopsis sp., V23-08]MEA5363260.1 TetR/AcrR family transcriptional regulator [Amycolatopsis sp., V23-08]